MKAKSTICSTIGGPMAATLAVVLLSGCQPYVLDENEHLPALNLEDAEVTESSPLDLPPATNDEDILTADEVLKTSDERETENDESVNLYDPDKEITIRGAVLGKRDVRLEDGHTGVIVELQPGGDFIDVLVGTTRFNESHDVDIGIADRIMVTGPVVQLDTVESKRLMLARELVWRDRTIELRDEAGNPHWEE